MVVLVNSFIAIVHLKYLDPRLDISAADINF